MFEVGYSMVRSYRRCPRQYKYKYIQHLQRKRPPSPLIRGTILHEMLNARALRSMRKPTRTPPSILNGYADKFTELFREEREEYGENFIEDIHRVWDGYERTYENDGWKYEASEEEIVTELNNNIIYKGHLDKRIIWRDRRWIVDHKSHKTIPDETNRFNQYQILLYLWCYNREVPKANRAEGLIWDYLRTKPPTIPERLKSGELTQRANLDTDYFTYVQELKRLRLDPKPYANYLNSLKQKSPTKFYLRVPLPEPSREMTMSVVDDFKQTAKEMKEASGFPRHMDRACSYCEYYRLCSAELRGLDHKFIEKTEFEEKVIGDENGEED